MRDDPNAKPNGWITGYDGVYLEEDCKCPVCHDGRIPGLANGRLRDLILDAFHVGCVQGDRKLTHEECNAVFEKYLKQTITDLLVHK